MRRFVVVNVSALDMKELVISSHESLEHARWAEESMTGYSVETDVIEFSEEAWVKVRMAMDEIEEMRESLRTGIRRIARASAASREETCPCSSDNQPGDDCGACRA